MEQVKARLNQLVLEKYQAVDEMLKITQTKDCIRTQLVGYFGQKLQEKPENCCENCGIHYDEINTERLKEEKKSRNDTMGKSIKTTLNRLLD